MKINYSVVNFDELVIYREEGGVAAGSEIYYVPIERLYEMEQLEYEQLAIDTAIAKMEEALDGAYSVDYKVNEITFSDISVESTNNIDYEVYLRANVNTAINLEFVEEYGESVNHHELILVTIKIIDGEIVDIMYQEDPRYAGHP